MEHARLFIAIVLSLLVFIVWNAIFVSKQKETLSKKDIQTQQQVTKDSGKASKETTAKQITPLESTQPLKTKVSAPAGPSRTITVNLPLYTAKISEKGAVFRSFVLKKYRKTVAADSPFLDMINPDLTKGTVRIGLTGNSIQGLDNAVFSTHLDKDFVDIKEKPKAITFSWVSPRGVVVEKRFLFSPKTYEVGLDVIIKNNSERPFKDRLTLSLLKHAPETTSRYGFEGPSALLNNKLEQIKIKKIKKQDDYPGKLKWVAIQDRYFISAIMPDKTIDASMHLSLNKDDILKNTYVQPEQTILPDQQHVFKYKLFFGPKSMSVLKSVDYDLIKVVNFGMFDIIAKPCVYIMDFIYHYIPNYGVAIIILTILSKILLWPLGTKSYKSMAQMKKIQPLMAEIKEKYKDDKKKMNEEMMALSRPWSIFYGSMIFRRRIVFSDSIFPFHSCSRLTAFRF
ncbi:MAG: membrane protein insertase YidC [Desulfobacterales bacterium]